MKKNRKLQNLSENTRKRQGSYYLSKEQKAKNQLHQLSLQSHYEQFYVPQVNYYASTDRPKFDQSIRTSQKHAYSTQAHTSEINFKKVKSISSRYMHETKRLAVQKLHINQPKNRKHRPENFNVINKINIDPINLSTQLNKQQTQKYQLQRSLMPRGRMNGKKFLNSEYNKFNRIHSSRENRFKSLNKFSYKFDKIQKTNMDSQSHYYSFNETIMGQSPNKQLIIKQSQGQQILQGDKRDKRQVRLRPQFIRLLKNIKEREKKQKKINFSSKSRIHTAEY